MQSKSCSKCKSVKPIEEFYVVKGRPHCQCKQCGKEATRSWEERNRESIREYRRKWANASHARDPHKVLRRSLSYVLRDFGLPADWYEKKFAEQLGVCEICGKAQTNNEWIKQRPKRLSVDHCHTSGKVRGLLCSTCNKNLGVVENADFVAKAYAYIKKYETH